MSAIGTKRTYRVALHMSAVGGKADIHVHSRPRRAGPAWLAQEAEAALATRRIRWRNGRRLYFDNALLSPTGGLTFELAFISSEPGGLDAREHHRRPAPPAPGMHNIII